MRRRRTSSSKEENEEYACLAYASALRYNRFMCVLFDEIETVALIRMVMLKKRWCCFCCCCYWVFFFCICILCDSPCVSFHRLYIALTHSTKYQKLLVFYVTTNTFGLTVLTIASTIAHRYKHSRYFIYYFVVAVVFCVLLHITEISKVFFFCNLNCIQPNTSSIQTVRFCSVHFLAEKL